MPSSEPCTFDHALKYNAEEGRVELKTICMKHFFTSTTVPPHPPNQTFIFPDPDICLTDCQLVSGFIPKDKPASKK